MFCQSFGKSNAKIDRFIKFVNFPAKKICLHVCWAHGEKGFHHQAVQQLHELLVKPWDNCQPGERFVKFTDIQELAKFEKNRVIAIIAIPELPATSIKRRKSPGLSASHVVV